MVNGVAILRHFSSIPVLVDAAGEQARVRYAEFFAANIRNPHTRRAYARAAAEFLNWCAGIGVLDVRRVQPLHVSAWIEAQGQRVSTPAVKQQLAAIRHLFDWFVVGQVMPFNPAAAVRGPRHVVKRGKTPILHADEAGALIASIDATTIVGLRDRALIALMVYSFARISAALSMKVEDVYVQNRRFWVRLLEKGGKQHEMPCHHHLEEHLHAYLEASGLGSEANAPLFPTIGRGTKRLTRTRLAQANAHAMIRRRARAARILTRLGNHSFRATGITVYLKNGGTLEVAAAMANHSSTRTTQLYDRRPDDVTLAHVELIQVERDVQKVPT